MNVLVEYFEYFLYGNDDESLAYSRHATEIRYNTITYSALRQMQSTQGPL